MRVRRVPWRASLGTMGDDDGRVLHPWAGTLALGPWWLVFDGAFGPTEAHRHHAVQIVAADGPVVVEAADFDRVEGRLVVIPADTIHAIVSGPSSATVLFLDADSLAGRGFAVDGSLRSLDASSLPQRAGVARVFADADRRVTSVLAAAAGEASGESSPPSTTITAALALLADDDAITAATVAHEVGLSPSRFSHRFTAEVGIPFRSYRRWMRLLAAVELLATGATLTAAAHRAGFADSAHFSRTFRSRFGLSPTEALAASRWLSPD